MLFQGHRAAHTLLLMLGVGVPATGVFIVSTVLPSVVMDIGGAAFYAWSSTLYTVASILGTASGGFVRATLDLRRGYMVGALVFVVGSVGCALAPHMLVLVGARAVQGWGGGVLVSLSYGIARVLYPEDLRPRVLSTMSGVWGVAALLGPMVGGYLPNSGGGVGHSGWSSR
jgi:MFS family permease